MVMKFYVKMNVHDLYDMCQGQGHGSKIKVIGCLNVIFGLEKKSYY